MKKFIKPPKVRRPSDPLHLQPLANLSCPDPVAYAAALKALG